MSDFKVCDICYKNIACIQDSHKVKDCTSLYERGKADEKDRIENKVAEWFGRSQDGWIPCQQVIDFCEEIEE